MKLNLKTSTTIALSLLFGFSSCSDDDPAKVITKENQALIAKHPLKSTSKDHAYFILNEDWYGHDNGSINRIRENGTVDYRVYREANDNAKLGVTSQYGTVFGDNLYIMSKQGNSLVVADKNTLKTVAAHDKIGGDGRAFVGINKDKAYFSTSGGVRVLNLTDNQLGKTIVDDKGQDAPEIGNMVFAGKYVFGAGHNKVYVIDTETDILIKTLDINNPGSIVRAFDGSVWAGNEESLFKIDHNTLEFEAIQNISDRGIKDTWFAWNKGSFTASTLENTLYWVGGGGMFGSGKSISSYNIDTKEYISDLFILGNEADYKIEDDYKESTSINDLSFYGGALGINPLDGNIYATIKRDGWGDNGEYNWVFTIDTKGKVIKTIPVTDVQPEGSSIDDKKGYYWFPSMPLFNDYYKPEVLLGAVFLYTNEPLKINLDDIAFDLDNARSTIDLDINFPEGQDIFTHTIENNELIIVAKKAGTASFNVQATSNGVSSAVKEIKVHVQM